MEKGYIYFVSAKEFRARARKHLNKNGSIFWAMAIIIGLYDVIFNGTSVVVRASKALVESPNGILVSEVINSETMPTTGIGDHVLSGIQYRVSTLGELLFGIVLVFATGVAINIIRELLDVGFHWSLLDNSRRGGEKRKFTELFQGLKYWKKIIGLYLFQSFFIFLWSLLLVVPGIIAYIRYSMAYMILKDNPELSIRECVNESKKMMDGYVGRFFCLNLSFAGWYILAFVALSYMQSLLVNTFFPDRIFFTSGAEYSQFMTKLIMLEIIQCTVSVLVFGVLTVYRSAAKIEFYRVGIGEGRIKLP